MARSEWAAGRLGKAQKLIDALLLDEPQCADALDLQGRMRLDRLDFASALESYRAASLATPGCLLRAQHAGALAFYLGESEEAGQFLERARSMGVGTRLFDALSLFLLAIVRHDSKDLDSLDGCVKELASFSTRFPESPRLTRIADAARALWLSRKDKDAEAAAVVRQLAQAAEEDGFDLESAQVVVSLWVRVARASTDAEAAAAFAQTVALRFCSSRTVTEFLIIASLKQAPFSETFRQGLAEINATVEQAVQSASQGAPAKAILALLAKAEQHRNSRFVDIASMLIKRYSPELGPTTSGALARKASELLRRFGSGEAQIAGLQRATRSLGALALTT